MGEERKASQMLNRIDLRRNRAISLTGQILKLLGDCIADDKRNEAQALLFDAFYSTGAEVVTDELRRLYGLPERDLSGYTATELAKLEEAYQELLSKPLVIREP